MDFFYLALVWLLLYFLSAGEVSRAISLGKTHHVYSRDMLLQLNNASSNRVTDVTFQLPVFVEKDLRKDHGFSASGTRRKRKRGKRAGVRLRLRKQWLGRIPLPPVIMANVQSLRNKVCIFFPHTRLL